MKKSYLSMAIFELFIICTFILNIFLNGTINVCVALSMLVLGFTVLAFTFNIDQDNHRYNEEGYTNVVILACCYYLFIYILGLFSGFYWNSNTSNLRSDLKSILGCVVTIVICEMFRYIVATNFRKSKLIISLLVVSLTLVDIWSVIYKYSCTEALDMVELFGYYIIPRLFLNIAFTYITIKIGFRPNILYRLLFEIYIYVFPIIPSTGKYIQSVLNTILPMILFFWFYSFFESQKLRPASEEKNKLFSCSVNFLFFAPLVITIALVSGFFKYQALAVGSGSMTPNINMGDAVIVKKLGTHDEIGTLEEGDVLCFSHSKTVIVHRIKKMTTVYGDYYFYTKGDFNNSADSYVTKEEDVIGVVKYKIPYIGLPTVYINKIIKFK